MSRRWVPACVGLAGVLLGVVSCKGEAKEEPPTPYQKYESAYVDAYCAALAPCCALIQFDVATCRDFYGFVFAIDAGAANGDLFTFHQDRADQCLADIRSLGLCSGKEPPSCASVVEGTLAPGAPCNASAECMATGNHPGICQADIDGNGGHCAFPATPASMGQACTSDCPAELAPCFGDVPSAKCYPDMGLHCNNGTCQPLGSVGAACTGSDCVDAATCGNGLCVARVGPGAPCLDSGQCLRGNYCAGGLCTAQLPAGSTCDDTGLSDQCLGAFCTNGRCMDFLLETACTLGGLE